MKPILLIATITAALFAAAPKTISYQGVLTDNDGMPKADGSYEMTFSLYGDTTVDAPYLWRSTEQTAVIGGLFNVILGNSTPFDTLSFTQPYYLGIQVGSDAELANRVPLTAAGYAIRAHVADSAKVTANAVEAAHAIKADTATVALSVDGASVADGSITSAKIATGAVKVGNLDTTGVVVSKALLAVNATTAGTATNATYADTAAYIDTAEVARKVEEKSITEASLKDGFKAPKASYSDTAAYIDTAEVARKVEEKSITEASLEDGFKAPKASYSDTADVVKGIVDANGVTTSKVQAKDSTGLSLVNTAGNGIVVDSLGDLIIGKPLSTSKSRVAVYEPVDSTASSSELATFAGKPIIDGVKSNGVLVRINNLSTAENGAILRLRKVISESSSNYGDVRLAHTGNIEFATGTTGATLEEPTLVISNDGNVGIGTETPSKKLEIITTKDADRGIRIDASAVPTSFAELQMIQDSSEFRVGVGGSEQTAVGKSNFYVWGGKDGNVATRLVVNDTGNVGIGTISPSEKLEVDGNIKVNGSIIVDGVLSSSSKMSTSIVAAASTTYYLPLINSNSIVEYYIAGATSGLHTTLKLTVSTTFGNGTLIGQVTSYKPSGSTNNAISSIKVLYGSTYDKACIAITTNSSTCNIKVYMNNPFHNTTQDFILSEDVPSDYASGSTLINLSKSLDKDLTGLNGTFELNWQGN